MYTSMSSLFRERVCDWYYLWSQLEEFPRLTEDGIDMLLQVAMTSCWLDQRYWNINVEQCLCQ